MELNEYQKQAMATGATSLLALRCKGVIFSVESQCLYIGKAMPCRW